jgi:dipeptidyl aminopeptidase/acylaminoacyl peptidase
MTFRLLARTVLVVVAIWPLASPSDAQTRRAMTVDDVLDLAQLSAPRISPDGTRVLYTVSELGKWKDNKRVTSIWMVNADGSGARRFLGHERDRNAAWSPDGRFVAFLGSRDAAPDRDAGGAGSGDAGAQIWIIPSDGGEATKLTNHKGTIRSFEWTKDSASIVFSAEPAKSDAQKAIEKAGDDVVFVDEDANGQERGDFAALWRIGVADKTEQVITHDDRLRIESFRVSPDASRIAVIDRREATRNGQYHAEIAVVETATGALTDVTHNNAPEENVQWSPDGRTLSYLAPSDTSWELAEDKIWLVPASGGAPKRLLNGFNGGIRQYAWAPDGKSIVFGAQTRARGAAYRISVPAGALATIASGDWSGTRRKSTLAEARQGRTVLGPGP